MHFPAATRDSELVEMDERVCGPDAFEFAILPKDKFIAVFRHLRRKKSARMNDHVGCTCLNS